jgi:hypothetical protein
MENIIKTAIDGGYDRTTHIYSFMAYAPYTKVHTSLLTKEKIVLDPEFWNGIQEACRLQDWQIEDIRNNFFAEVFRKDGDDPKGWNSAVIYLSALITKLRE